MLVIGFLSEINYIKIAYMLRLLRYRQIIEHLLIQAFLHSFKRNVEIAQMKLSCLPLFPKHSRSRVAIVKNVLVIGRAAI
jgi:hypothetical protein